MASGTVLHPSGSGVAFTSAGKLLNTGTCCWKQAYDCQTGVASGLWLHVADIPASGVVLRTADSKCYNFPDPATPCPGTALGTFSSVSGCGDASCGTACYIQSIRCSDGSASGLWLRDSDIPGSRTIVQGGACYYFPSGPCNSTPGTLHAGYSSVANCEDAACSFTGDCPDCSLDRTPALMRLTLSGIAWLTGCQASGSPLADNTKYRSGDPNGTYYLYYDPSSTSSCQWILSLAPTIIFDNYKDPTEGSALTCNDLDLAQTFDTMNFVFKVFNISGTHRFQLDVTLTGTGGEIIVWEHASETGWLRTGSRCDEAMYTATQTSTSGLCYGGSATAVPL